MSASAADVMATVAAESRRDNKDCRCILNRDAWPRSHDCRMVPEPIEVAQIQLTDVGDPFDRHDHPFEAEAPREHGRLQTERRRHLGPEDAAPAELHPPLPVPPPSSCVFATRSTIRSSGSGTVEGFAR